MVMWLDPGKMTGWAALADGERFASGQLQMPQIGEFVEMYVSQLGENFSLGWEHFITTPRQFADAKYALGVIGVARWLCYKHQGMTLPPVPSSAKKLGSVEKLKALGWYAPGKVHANDASQHLLAWLLRVGALPKQFEEKIFQHADR